MDSKKEEKSCSAVRLVDLFKEWPILFAAVKNSKWFDYLARLYYSFLNGQEEGEDQEPETSQWKKQPAYLHYLEANPNQGDDKEIKLLQQEAIADPSDVRWWIVPHQCVVMNGLFLYMLYN